MTSYPKGYSFRFSLCFLFLFCVFFLSGGALNAAWLTGISGKVEIKRASMPDWSRADDSAVIQPGDSVRTNWRGRTQVNFSDGSRVELGSSSFYVLEKDGSDKNDSGMKLNFGWMKAWVKKVAQRNFRVRTPTAVCSVRGTEFTVDVDGNNTNIDLFSGALAVQDTMGNETLLNEGQHIKVDERGLGSAVVFGQVGRGPHGPDERHVVSSIRPYLDILDGWARRLLARPG